MCIHKSLLLTCSSFLRSQIFYASANGAPVMPNAPIVRRFELGGGLFGRLSATTRVSAGRGLTPALINCMQKLLRICRNGRVERGRRQRSKGKPIANGKGSSDCASARKDEHRRAGGYGREREGDGGYGRGRPWAPQTLTLTKKTVIQRRSERTSDGEGGGAARRQPRPCSA